MNKDVVCIIQKSVWNNTLSVPLAAAYLKSYAIQDRLINKNYDIVILNYNASHSNKYILSQIIDIKPNYLCFSVLGWNISNFVEIAKAYKQYNNKAVVIIGGVHVSNQGEKAFEIFPSADIIINGEGEITFHELLQYFIMSNKKIEDIQGISINNSNGVITTKKRNAIENLDIIPSPYLSGIIELRNNFGQDIYDAVLLETSRGCPYSCAYCSWANGMGNQVRRFSEQRLKNELEYFAVQKIDNIVLCDSNFGLFEQDAKFVNLFIENKKKYGYPKNLETSWPHSLPDFTLNLLSRLRKNDIKKSFSLSLQTKNHEVLKNINRKDVTYKKIEKISRWSKDNKMNFFIELIWGLPGETPSTFENNINRLSQYTYKFAVYGLILLPNSVLWDEKEKFKIVSVKEPNCDYQHSIANYSLTPQENFDFTFYLFWLRLLSENMLFRNIWNPLIRLRKLKFFEIIKLLGDYIRMEKPINNLHIILLQYSQQVDIHNVIPEALKQIYLYKEQYKEIILSWWNKVILNQSDYAEFFNELIKYELLTMPLSQEEEKAFKQIRVSNEDYLILEGNIFNYNFTDLDEVIVRKKYYVDFIFKKGFYKYMFNQEFTDIYTAKEINKVYF